MRLFASDRIERVMSMVGFEEGEAIESRMVTGAIETAQARVEGRNFDIRKHVLQYDDINNQQREMIYTQRNEVLDGIDISESIRRMTSHALSSTIDKFTMGADSAYNWDMSSLYEGLCGVFGEIDKKALEFDDFTLDRLTRESLFEHLLPVIEEKYAEKESLFGENMREVERVILLRVVDAKWMDHIDNMEQLRQGINLRAYAQRDPATEYKFEAMDMFEEMIDAIKEETVRHLFHIVPQTKIERKEVAKPVAENLGSDGTVQKKPVVKKDKVGRNDPCPCGSGKKYKNCCLGKED